MALSKEDVQKVAQLARLQLSEEEVGRYQEQLSSVLAYVEQLNELELDDVPPSAHAVARQNVFRPDESRPSLSLEEVLFNAPAHEDDQFLIQAVLDEE